jgi:hypothetical protein
MSRYPLLWSPQIFSSSDQGCTKIPKGQRPGSVQQRFCVGCAPQKLFFVIQQLLGFKGFPLTSLFFPSLRSGKNAAVSGDCLSPALRSGEEPGSQDGRALRAAAYRRISPFRRFS